MAVGRKQMANRANSIKRASEKLDISDRKVWDLIRRREINCIRIDGRTLITDQQIDEFLQKHEKLA